MLIELTIDPDLDLRCTLDGANLNKTNQTKKHIRSTEIISPHHQPTLKTKTQQLTFFARTQQLTTLAELMTTALPPMGTTESDTTRRRGDEEGRLDWFQVVGD